MWNTISKRKIGLLIVAVFAAAAALGFGCGHTDLGPLPVTIKYDGYDFERGPDLRVLTVSLGRVRLHSVDVEFSNSMRTSSVELTVTDSAGNEFPFFTKTWLKHRQRLNLKGPFAFCEDYKITVAAGASSWEGLELHEDVTLSVNMKNPKDVDGDISCTADVALSPVFGELDGVLLRGNVIMDGNGFKEVSRGDIDTEEIFYVDYSNIYDSAGLLTILPASSNDDTARTAMLLSVKTGNTRNEALSPTHYDLNVWDIYDPLDETPTTSVAYDIPASRLWELAGPFHAGDLNGDGFAETILPADISINNYGVIQNLFIIEGPIPYGKDILLTDLAGSGTIIGTTGESVSHPASVRDLNGDGADDLSIIRNGLSDNGRTYDWQVWIMYGEEEIDKIIMDEPAVIKARTLSQVVNVDADDVDGDGRADLIVAELDGKSVGGAYKYIKPRIGIFFGDEPMDGRSMVDPDSSIIFTSDDTTHEAFLRARSLGDINGDGIADIGILFTQKDANGQTTSSKIFIFIGRETWADTYYNNLPYFVRATGAIDVAGYDVDFSSPAIGDINNDGKDDFMIVADGGEALTANFFLGNQGFSERRWRLDLDDADITWVFIR